MNDMTVICYLDVLGYGKIVHRHYNDKSIIKDIEKIILSSVGYLEDLKEKGCFEDPDGARCLFIFSKALVDAVDLEKKAKTARIVISESLSRFLQAKTDRILTNLHLKIPRGSYAWICTIFFAHVPLIKPRKC